MFPFQQLASLEDFSKSSQVFVTPESRVFAQALVHNQLPVLHLHPNLPSDEYVVLELTIHLAAVLLCAKQAVVQPLLQLAFFPVNMQVWLMDVFIIAIQSCIVRDTGIYNDVWLIVFVQRAFLPTMPDDMLAVANQAMGQLQWYCKYKFMGFQQTCHLRNTYCWLLTYDIFSFFFSLSKWSPMHCW